MPRKPAPTHTNRPFIVEADASGAIKVADAAKLLGVTPQTIRNWIDLGCPTITTGGRGSGDVTTIHLGDLLEWREERVVMGTTEGDDGQRYNESASKAKMAHYKAMIAQVQALERWRLVCPVDVIGPIIEERNARIRSILLGLPSSLNVRVAAESDPRRCYDMILTDVTAAMGYLQSGREVTIRAGLDPDGSVDTAAVQAAIDAAQAEIGIEDPDEDDDA